MKSKQYIIGYDIGGTKCAVILGSLHPIKIEAKKAFPTTAFNGPYEIINELFRLTEEILTQTNISIHDISSIGVSCGGPLDSKKGMVMSPPNLPGWDNIPVTQIIEQHYHIPTRLANDADAGALAEWNFGAGKGTEHMIFLTFGTGMGAGLILNGQLYTGACNLAGEVGHIRLAEEGPIGYGKNGSFEGFCSGGGIAKLAHGKSAKELANAMQNGDEEAIRIFTISAQRLAQALAILMDIFNPQRIVIGSIYARNQAFFDNIIHPILEKEVLPQTLKTCDIVPAALGEQIGDYAALGVALL